MVFPFSQGDPDEIARNYQEKKGAYLRIKKEVGDMKRFCQVSLISDLFAPIFMRFTYIYKGFLYTWNVAKNIIM